MSFESHVLEPEQEAGSERIPDNDEKTRFSMSRFSSVENRVRNQIKAYTEHVKEIMQKTGKTSEQVVAEEAEEVKRLGVAGFLEKNK